MVDVYGFCNNYRHRRLENQNYALFLVEVIDSTTYNDLSVFCDNLYCYLISRVVVRMYNTTPDECI